MTQLSFEKIKANLDFKIVYRSKFLSLFLMSLSLSASVARANDSGFALCSSECGVAKYYVGYVRTNQATLNQNISKLSNHEEKIYPQVADFKKREPASNINEQKIDLENGSVVSSIHRIGNRPRG